LRARFEDTVSAAKADRPGLAAALASLRDGDVLAVWRLDRLGRSLPHLIETVGALEARGVGFRSLTEAIDTTPSGGRLIFHVFGAYCQGNSAVASWPEPLPDPLPPPPFSGRHHRPRRLAVLPLHVELS
jgi:hypothetical protein